MKKILSYSWLALVALFMYIPVLILAFYSFTDSTTIGAVRGFSLHNYVTLFTTEELKNMIIGTVLLAVGAAVIASILGTVGAVGAFYSRPLTKNMVETANQIPVVNADVVTAFSICILLIVVLGRREEHVHPACDRTCGPVYSVCISCRDAQTKTDGQRAL